MNVHRLFPLLAAVVSAGVLALVSSALDLSAALTYGIGGVALCLLVLFGVPALLGEDGWRRPWPPPRDVHMVVVVPEDGVRVRNGAENLPRGHNKAGPVEVVVTVQPELSALT